MTILSQQYDNEIITSNEGITEKLLTEQKRAYVRRRKFSKLRID